MRDSVSYFFFIIFKDLLPTLNDCKNFHASLFKHITNSKFSCDAIEY